MNVTDDHKDLLDGLNRQGSMSWLEAVFCLKMAGVWWIPVISQLRKWVEPGRVSHPGEHLFASGDGGGRE